MIVVTQWVCPVCDTKNNSEHTISQLNEERLKILICEGCSNPTIIGVILCVRATIFELREREIGFVKVVGALLNREYNSMSDRQEPGNRENE